MIFRSETKKKADFIFASCRMKPLVEICLPFYLIRIYNCHFYLQAWFSGKKIGHRVGRTRKEAQNKAAEDSIKHLAGKIF